MFEKFGEFDGVEELNRAAEGLKEEGDIESLKELAKENGLEEYDALDYADGEVECLATSLMAALGKIEVECCDLKPKTIMVDWIEYIKMQCSESEEMCAAVMKKGKRIKGCIAELLKWSFRNQIPVDADILKAVGVKTGRVTLGIPGQGEARKIIRRYYLGK